MEIPLSLEVRGRTSEAWRAWLDRLPRLVTELLAEWDLRVDGDQLWHGHTSVVVPVRYRVSVRDSQPSGGSPLDTDDGERSAALKITYHEDTESRWEGLALRLWNGEGTIRLLRADPQRRALLLERAQRCDLQSLGDVEACEIVAGLYRRLHQPAPPQLDSLSAWVTPWLKDLRRLPRSAPIPHRLVEQAVALGHDLLDSTGAARLLHADLHYGNVLAAEREPWLVIDPKPVAGDPHYELAPMLINRMVELHSGPGVRRGTRRRFHTLIDVAELDEQRARAWVIVRMIINASWTIQDSSGPRLSDEEQSWISRCIVVAKAVHD